MIVRFTPSAEKDFFAAVSYLSDRSLKATNHFINLVEQAFSQLELFPDSGAPVPEFPNGLYRQIFAKPYRLFYRTEDDTIWITALYHDRQLPIEPE